MKKNGILNIIKQKAGNSTPSKDALQYYSDAGENLASLSVL